MYACIQTQSKYLAALYMNDASFITDIKQHTGGSLDKAIMPCITNQRQFREN